MRLWQKAVLILMPVLVAGCAGMQIPGASAPATPDKETAAQRGQYTVQRGDTLYAISRRYGQTIATLAAWNRLSPPYSLRLGQVLWVTSPTNAPPASTPVPSAPPVSRPTPSRPAETTVITNPRPAPAVAEPKRSINRNAFKTKSTSGACGSAPGWQWPAQGQVEKTSASTGRKGIKIYGKPGQPVHAAAAGEVVYNGAGLNGYYGKLIIIQHSGGYMGVYANNRISRVKEGDRVSAGQVIAEMGSHKKSRANLHFEMNCHKKSVDPLLYLP
jgi:lipoprotein NlpD